MKQQMYVSMVIVACVLSAAGCADFGEGPVFPSGRGGVYADGKYLHLLNATQDTLYYFMAPTSLMPLIDWTPWVDPETSTNRVLPHATRSFAYTTFWWSTREGDYDEVTVCFWVLVRQPGGTNRVDHMEYIRTKIR